MQQKEYKKNVLISAFNCSPYAGSEQYLGWSSAVATANYPYNSYTTCFSEAGEHSVVSVSNFQVPMMFGNIETLRLPDFNSNDAIKYDIFYERQGLEKFLRLHDGELTVDIYGKKIRQVKNRKYLLSSRVLPYKVIKTFALQMRPQSSDYCSGFRYEDQGRRRQ